MNGAGIVNALELSMAAYKDIQPYSAHTTIVMANSPSGAQYFLRRDGERLYITFRGSDSLKDWKTNLTFWKKTIPYDNTETKIRVHSGFLNAYKQAEVRDRIHREVGNGARIIRIAGHSQGAALAVLCAVDVEYNFPDRDIETVLFGCPRVGNKAFSLSYNKRVSKTVRVENGNDIVTKVPFALMGFRHVGAKIHVGTLRLPMLISANEHYPHRYYSSLLKKIL